MIFLNAIELLSESWVAKNPWRWFVSQHIKKMKQFSIVSNIVVCQVLVVLFAHWRIFATFTFA